MVGKSLCGQSAATWHLRVAKWSRGCSILDTDIDDELLRCLQSSLDFKGNEMILRECFMDLGSFPEDQKIPVAALIDMWSELYELVEDGIHVIANLHEINTRNLASLVVTRYAGFYFYPFVFVCIIYLILFSLDGRGTYILLCKD